MFNYPSVPCKLSLNLASHKNCWKDVAGNSKTWAFALNQVSQPKTSGSSLTVKVELSAQSSYRFCSRRATPPGFIPRGVCSEGGCVQEEIRFLLSPECIVGMLMCPRMEPTEAILIEGVERFSRHSGFPTFPINIHNLHP